MIFSQYSNAQRLAFLLVCVGFAMCLAGSIAPYWFTAESRVNDLSAVLGVVDEAFEWLGAGAIGNIKLASLRMGVWYYCVEALGQEECDSTQRIGDWMKTVRGCVFLNVLLSFIAMCVACCRCTCCSGGRTICHGVMTFIAGGFGCIAFIISFNKTEDLMDLPLINTSYGWAIYFYTIGSLLMVGASFLLCFAVPNQQHFGGVVIGQAAAPSVSVNVNNTNTNVSQNTSDMYNMNQPTSFEPLPYPNPQQHQQNQAVAMTPPQYSAYPTTKAPAAGYDYNNPV